IPDRAVEIVVYLDEEAHLPPHTRQGFIVHKRYCREDETRQISVLPFAVNIRVLLHGPDEPWWKLVFLTCFNKEIGLRIFAFQHAQRCKEEERIVCGPVRKRIAKREGLSQGHHILEVGSADTEGEERLHDEIVMPMLTAVKLVHQLPNFRTWNKGQHRGIKQALPKQKVIILDRQTVEHTLWAVARFT